MLRDRRLWAFAGANALSMVGYSLWTNWTTVYLVEAHRLTLVEAAWYRLDSAGLRGWPADWPAAGSRCA